MLVIVSCCQFRFVTAMLAFERRGEIVSALRDQLLDLHRLYQTTCVAHSGKTKLFSMSDGLM